MSEVSSACLHCGAVFVYDKRGRGRKRLYCSEGCRVRRWEKRTGNRHMRCADCQQDMWRGASSLPEGKARCLSCRRANPIRVAVDRDKKREYDRKAQANRRNRLRAARGLSPLAARTTPPEWNCEVCNALVVGASLKSKPGRFCKRHQNHYKGHRKRARKYGVHYEYINPRTIYTRDKWKCGLCHKRVNSNLAYPDPMSASLDHLIPMSRGGPHAPANVQCAHLSCNMTKRDGGHGEQLALVG